MMRTDAQRNAHAAASRIIERAQQAGALRPDFSGADLLFVFGSSALLARTAADAAPDAWRRGLAFMLDGLRTEAARPLPVGPLTREQLNLAFANLTSTR